MHEGAHHVPWYHGDTHLKQTAKETQSGLDVPANIPLGRIIEETEQFVFLLIAGASHIPEQTALPVGIKSFANSKHTKEHISDSARIRDQKIGGRNKPRRPC